MNLAGGKSVGRTYRLIGGKEEVVVLVVLIIYKVGPANLLGLKNI